MSQQEKEENFLADVSELVGAAAGGGPRTRALQPGQPCLQAQGRTKPRESSLDRKEACQVSEAAAAAEEDSPTTTASPHRAAASEPRTEVPPAKPVLESVKEK